MAALTRLILQGNILCQQTLLRWKGDLCRVPFIGFNPVIAPGRRGGTSLVTDGRAARVPCARDGTCVRGARATRVPCWQSHPTRIVHYTLVYHTRSSLSWLVKFNEVLIMVCGINETIYSHFRKLIIIFNYLYWFITEGVFYS